MPVSINRSGTVTSILYDGNVARAKKTVGTTDTYYIGEDYEVDKQGTTTLQTRKYVFAGGTRVAVIRKIGSGANTYFYFHKDHLGSSTITTDSTGAAASAEFTEYLPFGGERSHSGTTITNYKYTDQELDPETGLYNYGARLYDPTIGRFIGPDTIVQSPYDPQMLNRYAYCRNNPLIYTDPDGHILPALVPVIVGAVIGAVSAGIQSDWDFQATITGAAIGAAAGYAGGSVGTWGSEAYAGWAGIATSEFSAQVAGGIAGGVAAGATAGGMSAGIYGGNVGQSMLEGAGWGAVGGAAFGAVSGYFGGEWNAWRVGAYTLTGGGISELSGQGFETGAMFALSTALAAATFQHMVTELPSGEPGGKAVAKSEPHDSQRATQRNNNMLFANKNPQTMPETRFHEGSRLSNFLNKIPTFNAIGTFHDNLGSMYFSETAWNRGINFATALPAAAVTYGSFVANCHPAVNWEIYRSHCRR